MNLEQFVKTGQEILTSFGIKLLAALAILLIGSWIAKLLGRVLRGLLERSKVDRMLINFLGNLVYFALLTFVILAAISQLGVQTTSFVAVIGAAGLAVGLALQGSLANFAAGVLIIIFRPYRAGDYIEAGGVAGSVEQVQIFTTVLNTPDNKRIVVPNGQIMNGVITNYSANETRRIDLLIGVSYGDDLAKVKQVLGEILAAEGRLLAAPAPTIAVLELADSSVNLVVRPWVKTVDYWPTYFDLTEGIKRRFDSEGISIPFPQRDVHLYQHSV